MGEASRISSLTELAPGWATLRRPLWLFDPKALRGVYANPAALALWGAASLEELLSRDFSKLSPAVLARTRRLAEATRAGEAITEPWTFFPQGRPVTVQATISALRLDDVGPVLMFEAAGAEVEPAERRAIEALRHASTLISLFDAEGAALFTNPAAFATFETLQQSFSARFLDGEVGQAMFDRALEGETITDVVAVRTPSGRRWHHMDVRPVLDPVTGAAGVLLNERDVTERVEAEAARAAAEQKAAMAEARQRFLGEMSHELRTPLNAVIGFAELIAQEPLSARADAYVQHIRAGGARLHVLVNEMISLAEEGGAPALSAAPLPAPRADTPLLTAERPLKVLCVDDNPANRTLVVAMLEALGVACATACDGAEAVRAAQAETWDLILMDIQMPVMDGVAATQAIRALPGGGDLTIVALTANTSKADLARYERAGMDDCFGKPLQMSELLAALSLLEDGQLQRPSPARGAR